MNQNPASQKVKIYTFSALALTAIAIVLRIINFLCIFDTDIYYFKDHPLHSIYQVLTTLTVLWLISMLVFIPRHSFTSKTTLSAGILARSMCLFCGLTALASYFFFRESMLYYVGHAKLYETLALFSLPCAAYFLLQFSDKVPRAARALCGYMTLIWLGLILSVTYLNLFVPMNSPFKVTLHLAILGMMLHVLEDSRLGAGRPFRIRYLTCTLIALLFCGLSSFPVLTAYLLGRYPDVDYLFYSLLTLGFFLYLCTRVSDCYRILMVTPPASEQEIEEEKKALEEKKAKKSSKASDADENNKGDNTHVS